MDLEPGCYIESSWGIYGQAKMVLIAAELGYTGKEINAAKKLMLEHDMPGVDARLRDSEWDLLSESNAEQWLNDTIVPEGYSFGWNDGEFFLWSTSDWEECDAMYDSLVKTMEG